MKDNRILMYYFFQFTPSFSIDVSHEYAVLLYGVKKKERQNTFVAQTFLSKRRNYQLIYKELFYFLNSVRRDRQTGDGKSGQ
jgi:hypothetical protein